MINVLQFIILCNYSGSVFEVSLKYSVYITIELHYYFLLQALQVERAINRKEQKGMDECEEALFVVMAFTLLATTTVK